ncbi:MAG TPA: hypothetical protein VFD35_07610 [Pricia sp.]|nr:hypothetical protein [Pricia sp.]
MGISSLAQETMCYIGQHLVFADAEEVMNSLTGAGFDAKQIERVCHRYGQWIEDADDRAIEEQVSREHGAGKADELHYVSVDGAMYLTREEGRRRASRAGYTGPATLWRSVPGAGC